MWTLDDDHIVNGMEEFTCRLYGVGPRVKQVDVAREITFQNISYVVQTSIFGLVSPLISPNFHHAQHTTRVNLQVCIWRRALDLFPDIPSPLDHGYHVTEARTLEPFWFKGDVIPMVLVDILEEN